MIRYIVTLILLSLIVYFSISITTENFMSLPPLESPAFVHLYDNKGNKLNIALISKPFGQDSEYKIYLNNINKYIYIGITSYMEFPNLPTNPLDNYILEKKITTGSTSENAYNLEMYFKLCDGWLHCFRNPIEYLPANKPHDLISESDFINYQMIKPDETVKKEYDFIYSCPKVSEDSSCDDWVSHNKNWELCKKCLPILCLKYKLRGLLIGRKGCKLPDGCDKYISTTGWIDYHENLNLYNKCRFVFMPNQRDASPRVLTEGFAYNLPCIINRNILGGWKYIESKVTGEFFTDENDVNIAIETMLANITTYTPRQYIIDNYGPINSGKRLKKFIFDNFKDRVLNEANEKVNEKDVEYILIRNPLNSFTK
jgi:hypothetical protein